MSNSHAPPSSTWHPRAVVQDPAAATTALHFDREHELLLAGGQHGRVTAYVLDYSIPPTSHSQSHSQDYSNHHPLGPGTVLSRWAAHTMPASRRVLTERTVIDQQQRQCITSLLEHPHGVVSLASHSLHFATLGGWARWNLSKPTEGLVSATDTWWTGMAFGLGTAELIVASNGGDLLSVTTEYGRVTKTVPAEPGISHVKRAQFLCCGTATGSIYLKDPRTLRTESTVIAHAGMLQSMDVSGHLLATVGCSARGPRMIQDNLVKVYDLRDMRRSIPVPVANGPLMVKLHPTLAGMTVTLTQNGCVQLCDANDQQQSMQLFQVLPEGVNPLAFDLSLSGDLMCIADDAGCLHHWASRQGAVANLMSRPVDIASPYIPPSAYIDDDASPLNAIGMPYYDQELLSGQWPDRAYYVKGAPPVPVPTKLLDQMKVVDGIGYAPNLQHRQQRRNQTTRHPIAHGAARTGASKPSAMTAHPKFRSEREREQIHRANASGGPITELSPVEIKAGMDGYENFYIRHEIKYSRFGVEDFDFAFYNRTPYCGLETHMTNCYANAFLQTLFHAEPVRKVCIGHMSVSGNGACDTEVCLACELGYLFRMLETGKGLNCQATNFLRALMAIRQVAALGLVEPDKPGLDTPYSQLIQNFSRFLLDRVNGELKLTSQLFQSVCAVPITQFCRCTVCENVTQRSLTAFSIDLTYPKSTVSPTKIRTPVGQMVLSMMEAGFDSNQPTTRAWCEQCGKYSSVIQYRKVKSLPQVLTVQCGMITDDEFERYWKWDGQPGDALHTLIALTVDADGTLRVRQATTEEVAEPTNDLYRLSSVICQIQNGVNATNLISFIQPDPSSSQWYVFNDFLVQPVPTEEVVRFVSRWKIPAILQYSKVKLNEDVADHLHRLPEKFDRGGLVYLQDQRVVHGEVVALHPMEVPESGKFHVALDAEFVALSEEEMEYRSDGTKSIFRPVRMHLARVSLLRGPNIPSEGVPLVDHYIQSSEPVVDYLTEFSGITAEDIDPKSARHPVTTLKKAYRCLRVLADLGTVFIGHGLLKDFRTINIVLPPEQIIDTVDLYRQHGQRKISLRFLAWLVLGLDIQHNVVHGHDSIEDARIALLLYKHYKKLKAEKKFAEYLDTVYSEGRKFNWRAPHWDNPQQQTNENSYSRRAAAASIESPSANVRHVPGADPAMLLQPSPRRFK